MKLDVTKLPLGEALIAFVLAAVAVTFVLAFTLSSDAGIEDVEPGDDDAVAEMSPTPQAEETPADGGPTGGAIATSMGDNFFDANEVTVAAGESVTFDLSNDGQAIHNMRVAGPDGEYNTDDDTVSDPDLFVGGDTGALTWTAPDQVGEIIFRCDFHPVEMTGTITVE